MGLLTTVEGSYSLAVFVALGLATLAYLYLREERLYSHIPVLGVDQNAWLKIEKARATYLARGKSLVHEGLKKVSSSSRERSRHLYSYEPDTRDQQPDMRTALRPVPGCHRERTHNPLATKVCRRDSK